MSGYIHDYEFKSYLEIALKIAYETGVGRPEDLEVITVILVFQDMYYEKWHINVYFRVFENQAGNNSDRFK